MSDEQRTRFYTCELKSFLWDCRPTDSNATHSPSVVATALIPVDDRVPKFLDPLIVSYKVRNRPVMVRTSKETKSDSAQ